MLNARIAVTLTTWLLMSACAHSSSRAASHVDLCRSSSAQATGFKIDGMEIHPNRHGAYLVLTDCPELGFELDFAEDVLAKRENRALDHFIQLANYRGTRKALVNVIADFVPHVNNGSSLGTITITSVLSYRLFDTEGAEIGLIK